MADFIDDDSSSSGSESEFEPDDDLSDGESDGGVVIIENRANRNDGAETEDVALSDEESDDSSDSSPEMQGYEDGDESADFDSEVEGRFGEHFEPGRDAFTVGLRAMAPGSELSDQRWEELRIEFRAANQDFIRNAPVNLAPLMDARMMGLGGTGAIALTVGLGLVHSKLRHLSADIEAAEALHKFSPTSKDKALGRCCNNVLVQRLNHLTLELCQLNPGLAIPPRYSVTRFMRLDLYKLWSANICLAATIHEIERLASGTLGTPPVFALGREFWDLEPIIIQGEVELANLLDHARPLQDLVRIARGLIPSLAFYTMSVEQKDLAEDDRTCTICQETYLAGERAEKAIKLRCGHIFGYDCIKQWLKPNVTETCPLCRSELAVRTKLPKPITPFAYE